MSHHVLMCEPTHFRIAYEINPWMRRSNVVNGAEALAQWRGLRDALERLGVRIELVEQGADVPDMTFAANAGVAIGRRFIPANFRFPERQPEAARFIRWFEDRGDEIVHIHEPHYWEGEGDVLPCAGRVFAGYRFRTEERALDHLDEILGAPTVRLELADARFYHLDTCFCPIDSRRALYFPPAFSEASRTWLAEAFDDRNKLLERLKFLSIFSTNLDEFYMVRVAGLRRQVSARVQQTLPDGNSPREQLDRIEARVRVLSHTPASSL